MNNHIKCYFLFDIRLSYFSWTLTVSGGRLIISNLFVQYFLMIMTLPACLPHNVIVMSQDASDSWIMVGWLNVKIISCLMEDLIALVIFVWCLISLIRETWESCFFWGGDYHKLTIMQLNFQFCYLMLYIWRKDEKFTQLRITFKNAF